METFEEYLEKAKDMAEEAGDIAKTIAGEAVDKAKELTAEGSKARELAKSAKEQAAAVTLGVKDKINDIMQGAGAGKEIRQGIAELEALPEVEGSILYTMEIESLISYLRNLDLVIEDKRMDAASIEEEIKKVISKVQPAAEVPADNAEQQLIEMAKGIVFNACIRALDALN